MADEPIQIKKYGNRRLYDTRHSRHVTLEDLAALVRGGAEVRVVDAKTGADLTRQVLTQVILEQQERLELIPIELLHAVIRVQGTVQQAPLSAFLAAAARQLGAAGELWLRQLGLLASPPSPAAAAPAGSADAPPAGPSELDGLRARMEALLKRLDRK
jgi:polyhydroxyalkanoate synthesis repressor PhaR